MRKLILPGLALTLLFALRPARAADTQLNPLFSEGVVLQQSMKVPIFGKAGKADKVTVSFRNQVLSATANDTGAWRVDLAPLEPGGPWPLTVEGKNKIEFQSVYVGDVWLCSGQSNMVLELEKTADGKEAADFKSDQLRLFINNRWTSAGPEVNPKFSAVALHFGQSLQAARKQPLGLIVRAVGATSAEQWTPLPVLQRLDLPAGGELFEQHIKPLIPFAIKGVAWYQGEWNVERHRAYAPLMAAMITSWRDRWGQGDLPFLIVQLPRSGSGPSVKWPSPKSPQPADPWANLRQAQVDIAARVPNTALVVSFDDTDGDLHPKNKRLLGQRLALAARELAYHEKIPAFSPLLDTVTRTGDKIVLKFKYAAPGLKLADAAAGVIQDLHLLQNGKPTPAIAGIEGDSLIIDAAGQTAPFDIYYAWSAWPNGNLFSQAGLPVSPFRYEALRLRVISCHGNTLTLAANKPLLSDAARKTTSYAISGCTLTTVALSPDQTRITLTTAAPFPADQPLTITAPGLQPESATGPVPTLTATSLPGLLCNGEPIEEILLGELREKIDPAHILEQETLDPQTKPAPGDKWSILRTTEPFDIARTFGPKKDPLLHACFYVYSTTDQPLQLLTAGGDIGLKVFVNGKLIHSNLDARGLSWGPQDKMNNLPFNKGWNTVLLAIIQRGGRSAFNLRLLAPNSTPPTGVTYTTTKPPAF